MKNLLSLAIILLSASAALAQPCVNGAREVAPELSAETRAAFENKLAEAEAVHVEKPNEAESIIWLGRRTAYLGNYKKAIWIFSSGITLHQNEARLYRHRGHRYITLRCFDDAVKDLEKAVGLIVSKPDEVEPDGLPNARNIPTSTLHSNIYYHLGIAYYLKGDLKNAVRAFRECQKVSKNNDMRVATTNWHYMALRRLGRDAEARRLLRPFAGKVEVIENGDYLKLIKLYRGELKPKDLISSFKSEANTLSNATLGYGWGNWNLYNKQPEDAKRIFGFVTDGDQWSSFGFIASEVELRRFGQPAPSQSVSSFSWRWNACSGLSRLVIGSLKNTESCS